MHSDYQTLLQSKLTPPQYFLCDLLLFLLQTFRSVKLEQLARHLPVPILMESRRRKLQRFLYLKSWTVEMIWWPLISRWLAQKFNPGTTLHIAIDRTQWCQTNLIVLSLIYRNRGIPIHFHYLEKLGNSNYDEQIAFLEPLLELLSPFTIVLLGDREFCGVDLAKWLGQRHAYIALRLKKNEYVHLDEHTQVSLAELGIQPGERCWLSQVKVTKTKGFGPINVAARQKRKYRDKTSPEAWYIMTNLGDLETTLNSYSRRMGIEELFRDWKKGGYNLEDTKLTNRRLISMMIFICLAHYSAMLKGEKMQHQNIHRYVARPKEAGRTHRRHSAFLIGLVAESLSFLGRDIWQLIAQYTSFHPDKRPFYSKGIRAFKLAMQAL